MNFDILEHQNPWWNDLDWVNSDQHLRAILGQSFVFERPEIQEFSRLAPGINIIRGPRQVGKTTLLKSIIANLLKQKSLLPSQVFFLGGETLEGYKELEKILFKWLNQHSDQMALFLDEITFVKEWPRAILSLSNKGLLNKATVLITGSNARDLKESSERLPGRRQKGRDIFIPPLLFHQFKTLDCFKNKNATDLFELYLRVGGFPHAIKEFVLNQTIPDSVYQIYRNWIVGDAARYGLSESILKQILFRIHETLSSRITWNKIIENTSIKSHETAQNYLEHLEDAFITNILYCYDHNKKIPNLDKAKKVYFIDPLIYFLASSWKQGINNVFEWTQRTLEKSEFKGKLFEAIMVNQFKNDYLSVFFWYSSKTKQEVDLLVPHKDQLDLFEIKLKKETGTKQILGQNLKVLNPQSLYKEH